MSWQACHGAEHITPIAGLLWRLVESQEQIASMGYVETLEEQALLEEMLETVKPPYPEHSTRFHYLLKTPFRYPPLRWGSRFGRTFEPSIFYAAKEVHTTLAEAAYYRFLFWNSMDAKPIKARIRTEHSLFSATYQTDRGIKLQQAPFSQYQQNLTDPINYAFCQQLGSEMREQKIAAFEYTSARDQGAGICVGLFTLNAFACTKPLDISQWFCEVSEDEVSFKPLNGKHIIRFCIAQYLVEGELPFPA